MTELDPRELKQICGRFKDANARYHEELRDLIKPGDAIRWLHGKHQQFGYVEEWVWGDRLLAVNAWTGNTVKVDVYQIEWAYRHD